MAAGQSLGSLFVDLLLRSGSFASDLDKAGKEVGQFGESVGSLTDGITGKFQLALEGVAAALAGVAAASAYVGASFEQEITKVAVLAGGGLDELSKSAREMGATTAFSASDAAEAMESLAQAGFHTDEIISGTKAALDLAAASGGDLSAATKIVATTMSQFSLSAADSTRIADVFTEALNTSQLGMSDLTTAMSYAGTVGSSFGMTLEQTTAAVAMFSNLGLEGSKAGTAFRMSMSQAANVSKDGEKALARYGLTVDSINPSLHTFGEILDVVGKAGMSTNDAMKVFGTEVGGNVAALAKQAADANADVSKSFDGITASLMNSSGIAQTTAKAMTQTVAGAFEQASGAFQEVLLTVYDSYSGPLRDLLLEVADIINVVAVQFRAASAGVGEGGFAGALQDITAWLDENQNRLAVMIVDVINGLGNVARWAVQLLPYLDDIAAVMATIWAVNKAIAFGQALGEVWSAVLAVQGALAALGVEVSVLTAGLYTAVVAIGAVVAALAVYATATQDAEAAAQRLTEAQTRQAALNDSAFRGEAERMEARLSALQASARQELVTTATLSKAREAELRQILDLDAAGAVLAVRTGKLVDVNGELRTATSLVTDQFQRGYSPVDELAGAQADLASKQEKLAATQNKLKQGIDVFAPALRDGADDADHWSATFEKLTGEKGINNLEEAQARLASVSTELDQTKKAQTRLANETALAQRALQQEADAAQDGLKKATKSVSKLSEEQEKAAEAEAKRLAEQQAAEAKQSAAAQQKAHEELQDALANDAQRRDLARRRELALAAKQFDEEEALWTADAKKTAEIELNKQQTLADIRARFAAEDKATTDARRNAVYKAINDGQAAADAAAKDLQVDAASMSVQLEREKNAKIAGLYADFEANLDSIAGLSQDQRTKAIKLYESSVAADKLDIEKAYAAKIAAAQRAEIQAAIAAPSKLSAAWKSELDKIRSYIPDTFEVAFGRAAKSLATFGRDVGAVFQAVQGAVGSVAGSINSLVQQISGFSFQIGDLIGSLNDAQNTATEAGTGPVDTAALATSFVDNLATQAVQMAGIFATAIGPALQELAQQIPSIIQAIVDAIPQIVQALVDNMPAITTALADGIPDIISALIDALPPLFDALLAGLITVVQAVAAALPGLVTQLLGALPGMITALANAIPQIIEALVAAVPGVLQAIIDGLPDILNAIFEAIPQIVQALAEAIPQLVVMVLEAVPQIINAFVQSLPTLILAIFDSIPLIIQGIADALPDLIPALVGLIPSIFVAIIQNLPAIILALVTGIVDDIILAMPQIIAETIKGLVLGMVEVAKAFVDGIGKFFTGIFDSGKKGGGGLTGAVKKAVGGIGDFFSGLFDGKKSSGSAYSGMEYVPATMRMTVHQGERIVPADRNAESARTAAPAPAGDAQVHGGGMGGGGSFEATIAVSAEGRLLEATQVRAQRMGRATTMLRTIRRAGGVRVGFTRGKFSPYSG